MPHRGSPEVYQPRYHHPCWLLYLHLQFISLSASDIRHKFQQLKKGPETFQRDLLKVAFKVFDNREEEAKREKERERKAKYAFLAAAIKGRDQPGPSHPRTGLKTCPPTRTLLPMQPVRTLGKGMPKPMAPHKTMPNLWPVGTLEDGLSPPPRPGEWNVHRDALAPLGKSPLLPRTPAQPYKSCSNDGARVPAPWPCPKHELGT